MNDLTKAACGRWPEILNKLGGVADQFLTVSGSQEGPCPNCGGNTRYRFDDKDGNGTWFCSHCGGKDQKGGGGTGYDLLMRMRGWTFAEARQQVQQYLGVQRNRPPHKTTWNGIKASGTWWYNPDFCVQRFDKPNGDKDIVPQYWTGSYWKRGQPPGLRPLYRLSELEARPNAFVLVVEGEKTADAAAKLFPRFVVTTWPGGCKACQKVDWSPLKKRNVALWPDADKVGRDAMLVVAGLLDAAKVRLIRNPEGVPEGWDVADSGWTPEQASEWLKANVCELPDLPLAPKPQDEPDEEPKEQGDSKKSTVDEMRLEKLRKLEVNELCGLLQNSLGDRLRYNLLKQQVEIDGEELENPDLYYIDLAAKGYKASSEHTVNALAWVAHQQPYDPVREYLERVEREVPPLDISCLATAYLRPRDEPGTLYDKMLQVTLIGAVKRAFEPGCRHQTACVLLGNQGIRKSTFWEVLGGDWFDCSLGDLSNKDDLLVLHRSWIQEWGEIDQITSRKHAGTVKAFVSRACDTFRRPYARTTSTVPRRGILVGSTNKQQYLVDETGNRRFLTIPCELGDGKIDVDSLQYDRDAIWAGAVQAYRAGQPNWLSSEDEAAAAHDATEFLVESPWEIVISTWLDSPDGRNYAAVSKLTSGYLLTNVIQKPVERQTRADQMAVADIMRTLGWEQHRSGSIRHWLK